MIWDPLQNHTAPINLTRLDRPFSLLAINRSLRNSLPLLVGWLVQDAWGINLRGKPLLLKLSPTLTSIPFDIYTVEE